MRSVNGDYILSAEDAQKVIATFKQRHTPLVIDYEHRSVDVKKTDTGIAIAAGWIHDLRYGSAGLEALIEWTPRAKGFIKDGEYRYTSPAGWKDEKTNRFEELVSVGLINDPGLVDIPRLTVDRRSLCKEAHMSATTTTAVTGEAALITEIRNLVGVNVADGSKDFNFDVDFLTALRDALRKKGDKPATQPVADKFDLAAVAKALGLEESASRDLVIATANTHRAASSQMSTIQTEIADLKGKLAVRDANDWLAPYAGKGLIGLGHTDEEKEADRKMILKIATSDRADAERILKQREALLPKQGKTTDPGTAAGGGANNTRDRAAVIASAAREFDEGGTEGRVTTRDNYINAALLEKKLPRLDDKERAQYAAV